MHIGTIVAPSSAPQTPVVQPAQQPQLRLDEQDQQLLSAIRQNGRYGEHVWKVLNQVAAAQNPKSRAEARSMRLALWGRLKRLIHAKLVFRFYRRSVTAWEIPPPDRPLRRHRRRPSVRLGGGQKDGSTVDHKDDVAPKISQHPVHAEPVHARSPMTKPARQDEKTKSDPAEISGAARALSKLPRKPVRRWTGWLHGTHHLWRGAQVVLPGGRVGSVYGILRGQVIVLKDPMADEFPPFEVYKAAEIQRYKNRNAVALGHQKFGVRERRSIRKLFAAWRNGRQPVRPGHQSRGRPRTQIHN